MNLFIRLIFLLLRTYLSSPAPLRNTTSIFFRAWPHDLRMRDHLPNQRFFNFMELGRFQSWHRSRRALAGKHSNRIIAAQELIYIKPIGRLRRFEVLTDIAGWDTKYIYYRHEFRNGKTLYATGLVKEACLKKGRIVPPESILGPPPPMPDTVVLWQQSHQALKQHNLQHQQS